MTGPIRADEVEPENVEWLWRELIPRSMFSMIAGRPDQGKSMVAMHIAAEVTKAGGNVLYSSKERAFGITEKPRLLAAGGIEEQVFFWRFSLPQQFDELADHIVDNSIDLVVMDPVSAHFRNRSSDGIREILSPLTELIEATGTAVLFIEHALKRVPPNSHPLNAVAGSSSGLPAACAMAFLWGTDPSNEEAKVLAPVKHNIRDKPAALAFEVDTVEVDGIEDMVPMLMFDSETVIDPVRLVAREPGSGKVGRPSDKRAAAAEWLTNYLAEAKVPVAAAKIQEDAKQYGMTGRTLRRAAQDMGIVKNPPGGGPKTTWELPEEILELLAENDDEKTEAAGEEIAESLEADTDNTEGDGDLIDDADLAKWLEGSDDAE